MVFAENKYCLHGIELNQLLTLYILSNRRVAAYPSTESSIHSSLYTPGTNIADSSCGSNSPTHHEKRHCQCSTVHYLNHTSFRNLRLVDHTGRLSNYLGDRRDSLR